VPPFWEQREMDLVEALIQALEPFRATKVDTANEDVVA
jgi:hypothetical protein